MEGAADMQTNLCIITHTKLYLKSDRATQSSIQKIGNDGIDVACYLPLLCIRIMMESLITWSHTVFHRTTFSFSAQNGSIMGMNQGFVKKETVCKTPLHHLLQQLEGV